MLGGKEVLPRVGFGEVEVDLSRLKSLIPSAFSFGLDEPAGGVVQVGPVGGSASEPRLDVGLVEVGCHPRDAGVVEGVLQGFGHAFVLVVGGDVAHFGIGVEAQVHAVRSLDHGFEGQGLVPVADVPREGVHHDRHAVVPNHAARVIRGQFPHGQLSAFAVHPEHGAHHVPGSGRFNPRQKRVQGPVGVPQAEHGVMVPFVGIQLMHLKVCASVASVHVAGQIGHGGRVVERGVERGSIRRGATFHLDAAELVVPARLVLGQMRLKPKLGGLGLQIGQGPLDVAKAQGHMDIQFGNHAEVCHKHRHHGHLLRQGAVCERIRLGDDAQLISPIEILVELHREVHVLLLRPILGHAMSHQHA